MSSSPVSFELVQKIIYLCANGVTHFVNMFSVITAASGKEPTRSAWPYTFSTSAMPCPPPMHAAPTAVFTSPFAIACARCAVILAPDAPSG
eukprot:6176861-Pleurochrysis_carterae.AAC.3